MNKLNIHEMVTFIGVETSSLTISLAKELTNPLQGIILRYIPLAINKKQNKQNQLQQQTRLTNRVLRA